MSTDSVFWVGHIRYIILKCWRPFTFDLFNLPSVNRATVCWGWMWSVSNHLLISPTAPLLFILYLLFNFLFLFYLFSRLSSTFFSITFLPFDFSGGDSLRSARRNRSFPPFLTIYMPTVSLNFYVFLTIDKFLTINNLFKYIYIYIYTYNKYIYIFNIYIYIYIYINPTRPPLAGCDTFLSGVKPVWIKVAESFSNDDNHYTNHAAVYITTVFTIKITT